MTKESEIEKMQEEIKILKKVCYQLVQNERLIIESLNELANNLEPLS